MKNEDFEVLNERVFVTGDCADAFGYVGWHMLILFRFAYPDYVTILTSIAH